MKEIIAIIRRQKLKATKDALASAGFTSLHFCDVEGRGRERGLRYSSHEKGEVSEPRRDSEVGMRYLPKKMLSLVAEDKDVSRVVHVIMKNNRTGSIGDGKVFVLPVENALRIRTGEAGKEAL